MKNIIKLIEYINRPKSSILFNPTLNEIKKLIQSSIKNAEINYSQWKNDGDEDVRFLVHNNNYYFGDANEYTHGDMAKELGISLGENIICGGVKRDGYVWFYKYMLLDYINYPVGDRVFIPDNKMKEMFIQTVIGKILSPIITEIEYE